MRSLQLLLALLVSCTSTLAFHPTVLPRRASNRRPVATPVRLEASGPVACVAERRAPDVATGSRSVPLPRRWLPRALLVAAAVLTPSALMAAGAGATAPALGLRLAMPTLRLSLPSFWSIPIVAGVLNFLTNKLAVKMMFYPLRFRGIGRFGWQGIVPSKAKPMANDIVDNVMLRLIDVPEVFARLPPDEMARKLDANVLRVAHEAIADLPAPLAALAAAAARSEGFNATLLTHGRALLAGLVRDVQRNAEEVFDLRDVVVRGMTRDSLVLVRLFERCGERDLKFVVSSGLFLGGALGVLQMCLWRVWSPWWSLALTGGAVGYVTDLLAIKLLFEPVAPVRLGPLRLHGLFLQRQHEVAEQFSSFMQREVLAAPRLWDELTGGARRDAFWRLVPSRVHAYLDEVAAAGGAPAVARALLGEERWRLLGDEIAARLAAEVPRAVPALYELTDESLQLQPLMRDKMVQLSSAEFERVLHPVFEEDELTLILIGTGLGGAAGVLQAMAGI